MDEGKWYGNRVYNYGCCFTQSNCRGTNCYSKEGSNITIEVEDNPELSAYLWNENDRLNNIPLNDNKFSPPSSKGRYIYEVIADWSNGHVRGEVSYTFVVEVK